MKVEGQAALVTGGDRAVQDGELPEGTDCATLARYVASVLNGLAVQAASGATEKKLRLVSAMAM